MEESDRTDMDDGMPTACMRMCIKLGDQLDPSGQIVDSRWSAPYLFPKSRIPFRNPLGVDGGDTAYGREEFLRGYGGRSERSISRDPFTYLAGVEVGSKRVKVFP